MGYHMWMMDNSIEIKPENEAAAADALRALACAIEKRDGYQWVHSADERAVQSLDQLMEDWNWTPVRIPESSGPIVSIEFDGEKLVGDGEFWATMAPFIESGGYVEMVGEDSEMWRWCFVNGDFYEVVPIITWPEPWAVLV